MIFRKSDVHAKLVGGLGNQLFVYHAGLWLARTQGRRLSLDFVELMGGAASHGNMLDELTLDARAYGLSSSGALPRRVAYRLANLILSTKLGGLISRKLSLRFFTSRTIGFDPLLISAPQSAVIQGYFQSYIYVTELREKFDYKLNLDPKEPSAWFSEMRGEFSSSNRAVVHVRRGDYSSAKDTLGLLDSGYYSSAWELLHSIDPNLAPIVFSDDVEAARLMLGGVLPSSTEYLRPPIGTPDSEILALMSYAKAIIIANSTFSWWGAALNDDKCIVVAPSKWFRSGADPAALIPPEWMTAKSEWVE